jgi:poly-gamma-glutamate synthesis protein (capsule biosynthesis protein)
MIWSKNVAGGKDGIVAYSLGNFISNQRKPKTDGGSIVRIEFKRKENAFVISDAGFFITWVYTPIEKYRKKFFILPCSQFENNPDFFDKPDAFLQMKKFISDSKELLNKQNINIKEYIFNGSSWVLYN